MAVTGTSPSAALLGIPAGIPGLASSYGSGSANGMEGGMGDTGSASSETVMLGGVPIRVQTAPGIKLLVQVPKADVMVNLPSLLRFILAHFADLLLLKSYLQICKLLLSLLLLILCLTFCSVFVASCIVVGGDFAEEHLLAVKMIMEKACKYLLLPGLDMTINLNGKVSYPNMILFYHSV
jgi:hypothetical protein